MGYMTAGKLQQVENQLQSYQILFWLCVAGAIIFAIVAIFLFFYFHIPTVFLELTGIRRKWAIQKIQKSNAPIQLKKPKKEPKIVKEIGAEETQLLSENVTTGEEETAVLKPQDMFVVEKELKMV